MDYDDVTINLEDYFLYGQIKLPNETYLLNSFKFSGLANQKVLNVSPKFTGKKESIVLTTRHTKDEKASAPKSIYLETGLKKETKKGLAALAKAMDARYCRRDLLDLATTKYSRAINGSIA